MNLVTVTRTVNVTPEDIAQGKRNSGTSCPVALAAFRVFPEVNMMYVYEDSLTAWNPPVDRPQYCVDRTSFDFDDDITEFICEFDANKEVQPFSFDLTLSVNEAKLIQPSPPPTVE